MRFMRAKVFFCRLYFALGESFAGEIRIDLKRNSNPVRTYLHEQLHLKHPEWKEWRIMLKERKIWKKLTNQQVHQMGKRLFNRKWKKEEE